MKYKKYSLFLQEVELLRYVVSEQGVLVSPVKVSAILNWPVSSLVCNIWAFIGLNNYSR